MPPEMRIKQTLRSVARRMKAFAVMRRVVSLTIAGSVLSLLLLAAAKTGLLFEWRFQDWPIWYNFLPLVGAVVGGLLWGLWGRISDFEAAQAADAALGLHERLGSAVVLANHPPKTSDLLPALYADAAESCSKVRPGEVTGPLFPRHGLVVPLFGAALVALALMPQYYLFTSEGEILEREAVRAEGARLLELSKDLKKRVEETNLERAKRLADKIEALGQELARGGLGKREAMKEAAELTDEIKAEHRRLAENAEVQSFQDAMAKANQRSFESEAAAEMMDSLAKGDVEAAKRQIAELQKKLQEGTLSREEQEALAEDLNEIAKSLENTAARDFGESLRQAGESLQKGDQQGASDQLGEAREQMEENPGARGLSEMEQLEAMAREMEFSESQMAQSPQPSSGNPRSDEQRQQSGQKGATQSEQQGQSTGTEGEQQGEGGARRLDEAMVRRSSTDEGVTLEGPWEGPREDSDSEAFRDFEGGASQEGANVRGRSTRVRGQVRDLEDAPMADVRAVGPRTSSSAAEYEVRPPTQMDVEEAIERENVPTDLRPLTRDYFEAVRE